MTDETAPKRDWRDTVFLPKTDFPMKAGLAAKEPAILAKWAADDLYGQEIEVALIDYLRPEARFDGIDALIAQMDADCARAREVLSARVT